MIIANESLNFLSRISKALLCDDVYIHCIDDEIIANMISPDRACYFSLQLAKGVSLEDTVVISHESIESARKLFSTHVDFSVDENRAIFEDGTTKMTAPLVAKSDEDRKHYRETVNKMDKMYNRLSVRTEIGETQLKALSRYTKIADEITFIAKDGILKVYGSMRKSMDTFEGVIGGVEGEGHAMYSSELLKVIELIPTGVYSVRFDTNTPIVFKGEVATYVLAPRVRHE